MHKSLSERWAEYVLFHYTNRYVPRLNLVGAFACLAVGLLMPSRGYLELAALSAVVALWSWERLGVFRMLKRANFEWDSDRGWTLSNQPLQPTGRGASGSTP